MRGLQGVFTAIVTPFHADGTLNLDALPGFLEFQSRMGINGIVVSGTNGEGVSLSVEERKSLLEFALKNRGELLVIAGTGAASVTDAIELTRHAESAGADAALILPPFFFKNPSAQGVAAYFRQILDATSSIPFLLYSIPQFSAVAITDEVIALLADQTRVIGLKDSAGRWDRTEELMTKHSELLIFPGSDDLMAKSFQAGARGAISGTANAFPELVSGIYRAHQSGGDPYAAQTRLDEARKIMMDYPIIAVSKSILAHRGVERMWVRPPLVDLTSIQERELLNRLHEKNLL
jgi:4-hydroxy-tetrahydrodipicolinate synthase